MYLSDTVLRMSTQNIQVGDIVQDTTGRLGEVVSTRYAGLRVQWADKAIWHGYGAVQPVSDEVI